MGGEGMKIKFSHNYYKLHNQTKAQLISVKRIVIDKDTNKGVWQ